MTIARASKLAGVVCIAGIVILTVCVFKLHMDAKIVHNAAEKRYESTLPVSEARALPLEADMKAALADMEMTMFVLSISVLAISIVLLAGVILLLKKIVLPLKECVEFTTAVSGGDLDAPSPFISGSGGNELSVMCASLDAMVKNLKDRIQESGEHEEAANGAATRAAEAIQHALEAKGKAESGQQTLLCVAETVDEVTHRLFNSTESLVLQVRDSENNAEQQRENVAYSLAAMEQMNSAMTDIAKNTSFAAEEAEKAKIMAVNGESVMKQSVKSIHSLQQDTGKLKEQMHILGKQAEAIGAIMTMISDIADQTNLLALNAAIEAARAGDAGRGFAVVADEVRKLAEKTMGATTEVGQSIKNIQNGTRASISTVDHTAEGLGEATELVGKSGDALMEIVRAISQTALQISDIAIIAEEQSVSSEMITKSLDDIKRKAEYTANAMHNAAQATSELTAQARELQSRVDELRGK
jgi:methyl-accepting chemotaxis protein